MSLEKNDSSTSTRIKTVAVKKRPAAEPKKEPAKKAVKPVKRTKLAVRVVAGDFKAKEEVSEVSEENEGVFTTPAKDLKKNVKKEATEEAEAADNGEAEEAEKKEGKNFFQKINKQIAEDEMEKAEEPKDQSRPVGFYRKISFFFILLTLLLLGAAFYFFFMRLTVEVTPKKERVSNKMAVMVSSEKQAEGISITGQKNVNGLVERIPVKEEKIYSSTGAEILGQEIVGKVTIINNYNQSKTLIATTRLLSPEGKMFRIKDKIDIPAGGSKEVVIYADEPSEEMALKPTEFTIPGLWAGLQDKIYGKSSEAFVYQSQVKKFVQEIDLENANKDLKESLMKKVASQFGEAYKGFDKIIAELDKNSFKASSTAKTGDKTGEFSVSLETYVNIIALNKADVERLAEEKLVSVIQNDKRMIDLERQKIEYNLVSSDFEKNSASLEISFVGTTMLSKADNIIDKGKLVGLSESQIKNYLRGLDKFSDFNLIFRPSFIKKAPALVDRISIVIK